MALKWQTHEDGNSEWAWFECGPLRVHVCDEDGDSSVWHIEVARGEELSNEPYHFEVALEQAEKAFREIAEKFGVTIDNT